MWISGSLQQLIFFWILCFSTLFLLCIPKSETFLKLQQGDRLGRISIMALFNYIMRKVWLHQTRIGLSLYDITGQGFLRESDLENYILELIETLPQLDGLEKSFHPFYVCTAVRKFFFFLDPSKTGKIKIQDVLACSFLDDLLELRDQELSKEGLYLPREFIFELLLL